MIDRICVESVEHLRREEDASLPAFDLGEEVLLLVVVARRHVARLADQEQIRRELAPLARLLTLTYPGPVEALEVLDELLANGDVQLLLKIIPSTRRRC